MVKIRYFTVGFLLLSLRVKDIHSYRERNRFQNRINRGELLVENEDNFAFVDIHIQYTPYLKHSFYKFLTYLFSSVSIVLID